MSLIQNARKPTLSALRSCSRARYNSTAPPDAGARTGSLTSKLFSRMEANATAGSYRGVEIQNLSSPKVDTGGTSIWKKDAMKLTPEMRVPYRPRPRPTPAPQREVADPAATAERMVRAERPVRAQQGQQTSRDFNNRGQREGSLSERVEQAGGERIKFTPAPTGAADGAPAERTRERRSRDRPARDRPARTPAKVAPMPRMSGFRSALGQPAAPASLETEALKALEVPKEASGVLVIKPRKKDVRVEKGVRKVKKRIVMRGPKRIIVDPRVRPILERYGGDYSHVASAGSLGGLHRPARPMQYAKATLMLRPGLSRARRAQALGIIGKHVQEARVVA